MMAGAGKREPLSKTLKDMVGEQDGTPRTLNGLLAGTGGRGICLVIVFLALPFCLPILPGVSTPFGIAIILLALRKMFQLPGRLPKSIGDREFEPDTFDKILNGGVKILGGLEKVVHARLGGWLGTPPARVLNMAVIALMGLVMALPLPVPGTNTIPAWAILIIAASAAEGDGLLIWLGYILALGSLIYLWIVQEAIVKAWQNWPQIWASIVEGFRLVWLKWSMVLEGLGVVL